MIVRSMLGLVILSCQLQGADNLDVRAVLASIVCSKPCAVQRDQYSQWRVLPVKIPDDVAERAHYDQEQPFEEGEMVAIKEDGVCYLGMILALEDPAGDFYRVAYRNKHDLFGPIVNADKLGKFADDDRLNIIDFTGG